jgi:hypothetical protein
VLLLLRRHRDVLERALRRARRAGHRHVGSAGDLQQLALLGHAFDDLLDTAGGGSGSDEGEEGAEAAAGGGGRGALQQDGAVGGGGGGSGRPRAPATAASMRSAVEALSGSHCWALPLPLDQVHLVSDLQGLQRMHAAVFGQQHASGGAGAPGGGGGGADAPGSSGGGQPGQQQLPEICGLDCEWEPFERGQAKTPVALLQLAFRRQAFLLDLLQLCQPGKGPGAAPSETEAALSHFFGDLMASGNIVKVGFQLGSDLDRLQESYPWLGCFSGHSGGGGCGGSGGSGSGVVRAHVDVLQLARALHPRLENLAQTSLSRLVQAVLGRPLDKAQQRSSWAERPLSAEQLVYAATDASCLVALFDELVREYPNARQMEFLGTLHNGLHRLPCTKE